MKWKPGGVIITFFGVRAIKVTTQSLCSEVGRRRVSKDSKRIVLCPRKGGRRESGPYKWAVSPFLRSSSHSHLIPSLIAPLSSLRSRMGHVALAALHSDPIRARVPCSKFRPAGRYSSGEGDEAHMTSVCSTSANQGSPGQEMLQGPMNVICI